MQSKIVCDLFKECEPLHPYFSHQLKIKEHLMNSLGVSSTEHFWKINPLISLHFIYPNTHNYSRLLFKYFWSVRFCDAFELSLLCSPRLH